jgi:hypothetical protein
MGASVSVYMIIPICIHTDIYILLQIHYYIHKYLYIYQYTYIYVIIYSLHVHILYILHAHMLCIYYIYICHHIIIMYLLNKQKNYNTRKLLRIKYEDIADLSYKASISIFIFMTRLIE